MKSEILLKAIAELRSEVAELRAEVSTLRRQGSGSLQRRSDLLAETSELNRFEDELLELIQVRRILKVSRNTVLRLVKEGSLRAVKINQRTIRYAKSDVMDVFNLFKTN